MDKSDFVFFWSASHYDTGCYSQWYISDFDVDGELYCCMEQYMMAEKARLFGDDLTLAKILGSNDPRKIKSMGRDVSNFDSKIWDEHKFAIVYRGNCAKFSQNVELKYRLLGTGDKILVEASPYDKIWGIGMTESDPYASDPKKWRGENLLGKALMEVREWLRTQ